MPDDRDFLRAVYGSTRWEELEQTGWSDAQKDAFLDQQFEAQAAYYAGQYDDASFDVIVVDGVPAGRLYVARWADEIRVIDIALLPGARRKGVGTRLLEKLLAEGDETGKKVSIHVERENPALRLYERLGFRRMEERSFYYYLERPPRST